MAKVVLSQGALPNTDGADAVEVQLGTVTSLADAINVGVAGQPVVASPSKSGTLIRFNSINSTDGSIGVTLDSVNNEVVLAVIPAGIDHQNLLGAGTIDHTAIDAQLPTVDQKAAMDAATAPGAGNRFITFSELPAIPGDITGGANVNATGVGVFETKAGANLTFRGIVGVGPITVGLDAPNSEIELSLNASVIDHQTLLGAGSLTHAQLDAQTPTIDQKAAMTNAAAPSGTNPFATTADVAAVSVAGANVNTGGGIGVFNNLAGSTLNFRGIKSVTSAITTVLNGGTNEIDVNLVPGQISHTALADSGTIGHNDIDLLLPSTTEKAAMQAASAPTGANPFATVADIHTTTLAIGSNVNTSGVGVFENQSGNALNFRGVDGLGSLSAAFNASNNTIEISLDATTLDHDTLSNTGLNSHGAIDTHIADTSIHFSLSGTTPSALDASLGVVGLQTTAARADHKHTILTGAPVAIGSNLSGTATTLARSDHSHAIRETSGPTDLTVGAILDGQAVKRTGTVLEGFNAAPLGTSLPEVLVPGAGAVGVNTAAAPLDHRHAIATGTTATAIDASTPASGGTGNAYSLDDHSHSIDVTTGSLSAVEAGAASSQGASLGLARLSHTHAVTTAAPGHITVGDIATEGAGGALARASHTHSLPAPSTPATVDSTMPGTPGTSGLVAREDHRHEVLIAAATAIGQANDAGTLPALSRADHDHLLRESGGTDLSLGAILDGQLVRRSGTSLVGEPFPTIPPLSDDVPENVKATGADPGTEPESARADHVHATLTAAATGLDTASVNSEGAGEALARASHTHAISTAGVLSTIVPGATAADGAAVGFATKSHIHAVGVATPVALTVGGPNVAGVSTSFVRADHSHALPAFGTSAGNFAEGNDSRFPTIDEKAALIGASGTPSAANRYVLNDDTRLLPNDAQGPASGQLSGTYPGPSVVGVTDGGAIAYTFGTWADGEVLLRSGTVIESTTLPAASLVVPEALTPDAVGAIGSATGSYALSDHIHPINAGSATAIGQANGEGNSNEFARADHDHLLKESGGTELSLASIPDGQFLQRSGSTIIGATPAGGGGAGLPTDYTYVESAGEDFTTDLNFVTKTLLVTPASTGTYLISYTVSLRQDAGSDGLGVCHLFNTSTASRIGAEVKFRRNDLEEVYTYTSQKQITLTGAAETIEIQFKTTDAATTIYISEASIVLWRVV